MLPNINGSSEKFTQPQIVGDALYSTQSYNNQVVQELKKTNEPFASSDYLINKDPFDTVGTSIPFQNLVYSDILVNPSSVSISTFQEMAYGDPIIASALTLIYNLVNNKIGKYQHSNKKYETFINKNINNMVISKSNFIREILTAIWAGFYIGEKIYDTDGKYIIIKDVQIRPQGSIKFRVNSDGLLKEDGIIQRYFNSAYNQNISNALSYNGGSYLSNTNTFNGYYNNGRPNPNASRGDLDTPARALWFNLIGDIVIPKEKCIHYAFKGVDGGRSPFGRSLLRPVYNTWLLRTQLDRVMLSAAKLRSSDTPVIVMTPNQQNTQDGKDPIRNVQEQLSQLGTFGNNGQNYLVMQGKLGETIWIESIKSTANIDDLVKQGMYYVQQILTALGFPAEVAGMSSKGSYALGETQSDLLGRNIIATCVQDVNDVLITQYVKPLLELNFGENEDFGQFGIHDDTSQDMALNIDILNVLQAYLKERGVQVSEEYMLSMFNIPTEALEIIPPEQKKAMEKLEQAQGGVKPPKSYGTSANLTKAEGWDNK
jgi:hypothetical protein